MTTKPHYKVSVSTWERGLVLDIEGLGTTQTLNDCGCNDPEYMAADHVLCATDLMEGDITLEFDPPLDSFDAPTAQRTGEMMEALDVHEGYCCCPTCLPEGMADGSPPIATKNVRNTVTFEVKNAPAMSIDECTVVPHLVRFTYLDGDFSVRIEDREFHCHYPEAAGLPPWLLSLVEQHRPPDTRSSW